MDISAEYYLPLITMGVLFILAAAPPPGEGFNDVNNYCERIQIPECYNVGYEL